MPDQHDLLRASLRTLEDALAEAHYGPVRRTWGHRLALIVLRRAGVAQAWQVRNFWDGLAEAPHASSGGLASGNYVRMMMLHGALDNWHYGAKLHPPIDLRSRWMDEAAERIDLDVLADQVYAMCNRYDRGETQQVLNLFGATRATNFNEGPAIVHPRDPGLVVRQVEGAMIVEQMTWGFPIVLKGAKGQPLKPKPVNNARFDKLRTFWKRWASQPWNRCLIPTARFAEAVGERGQMTETWLSVRDQPIFAWAGLWAKTDAWGLCYTGVMTDCAIELAHIHDRSPVILDPSEWDTWLTAPIEDLQQFDRCYPAGRMAVDETSKLWGQR
jgi:putative SOS response-associated peptidase YedK